MTLANLKVGTRLAMGFGLVLCLLVVILAIGVTRLVGVGHTTTRLVDEDRVKSGAAGKIDSTTRANGRRALEMLIAPDNAYRVHLREKIAENKRTVEANIATLEELVHLPEAVALLNKLKEQRTQFIRHLDRVSALAEEGAGDEARSLALEQMLPALDALQETIHALEAVQERVVLASGTEVKESVEMTRNVTIAIGLLAVLAGIGFSVWLTRSITRPLNKAVAIAKTVASGDLTSRIEVRTSDETGELLRALKEMNDNLVNIVSQVRSGTETIA